MPGDGEVADLPRPSGAHVVADAEGQHRAVGALDDRARRSRPRGAGSRTTAKATVLTGDRPPRMRVVAQPGPPCRRANSCSKALHDLRLRPGWRRRRSTTAARRRRAAAAPPASMTQLAGASRRRGRRALTRSGTSAAAARSSDRTGCRPGRSAWPMLPDVVAEPAPRPTQSRSGWRPAGSVSSAVRIASAGCRSR